MAWDRIRYDGMRLNGMEGDYRGEGGLCDGEGCDG